jgi:hypothetical protein
MSENPGEVITKMTGGWFSTGTDHPLHQRMKRICSREGVGVWVHTEQRSRCEEEKKSQNFIGTSHRGKKTRSVKIRMIRVVARIKSIMTEKEKVNGIILRRK